MNNRKIKYMTTLLALVFVFFSACNRQTTQEASKVQNHGDEPGRIVYTLDKAIWSIYQDKNGHYWFGSNGNGVYFYNGKNVINYNTGDGIPGNQIRGIQGDNSGNIYLDTPDGIAKYDGRNFKTLTAIDVWGNKWSAKPEDLWFKGSGDSNGVYRYDGSTLYFLKFPEHDLEKAIGPEFKNWRYSPLGIYGIYKDKQGHMWFGTLCGGVFHFNGDSLHWIMEKELQELDDGRVPGIRSIIEDKDGNFWFSHTLNRYRVSESGDSKFGYEKLDGILHVTGQSTMNFPYFMSAVTDNKNQDLWICTYKEGVWRYDGKNLFHYPIKDGETDVLLYCLYKDNDGTVWLGTHNAGAYKFDGEKFEKFKFKGI